MGNQDMKKRGIVTALLMVALCAMSLVAVAGCAPAEQQKDAAALNRAYLSQANTTMMQLNADLEPFTAAVAANDVVTMEQAAASVYRDIDAFKSIKPSDGMKDIHAEYCAGCDDLKQALQSYVALYKDAADADVKDINESVAAIQAQYDSGIAHLQAADKKITELPGAVPSSSSTASDAGESSSGSESSSSSNS